MARTRHIGARMSQRGIKQAMIDLTLQFGMDLQDRCVLGQKALEQLIQHLRELERTAMQALDKGGIVVVQADGALITTYTIASFDQRRVHDR